MGQAKNPWVVAATVASVPLLGCVRARPTVWYCLAYNAHHHRPHAVDATHDRGRSRRGRACQEARLFPSLTVPETVLAPAAGAIAANQKVRRKTRSRRPVLT